MGWRKLLSNNASDEIDVIINLYPASITPLIEFRKIGEKQECITNRIKVLRLYDLLYGNTGGRVIPITFYNWIEFKFGVDITNTINRKGVFGKGSHGYYPTNFIMLPEAFSSLWNKENKRVFDFGCGKGANFIALKEFGYSRMGGVEYTESIYGVLKHNLNLVGISYRKTLIVTTQM